MNVDYIDFHPRRWKWNFPELQKEIPTLFAIAGKATVLGESFYGHLTVKVNLHESAKVIDWRKDWGDGIAINSDTDACIGTGDFQVRRLPKAGDKEVFLEVPMFIEVFEKEKIVTLDDARQFLSNFAEQMTKTWHYYFK